MYGQYHTTLSFLLVKHAPEKTITVKENTKPWLTSTITYNKQKQEHRMRVQPLVCLLESVKKLYFNVKCKVHATIKLTSEKP